MALNHYDAGVGDVIEFTVAVQVITYDCVGRDADIFVQNRAADAGAAADVAVVENDGILDVGVRMDADAAANYRSPDQAARQNGAAGHNGIDGMATAAFRVEDEFGRRVGIAG